MEYYEASEADESLNKGNDDPVVTVPSARRDPDGECGSVVLVSDCPGENPSKRISGSFDREKKLVTIVVDMRCFLIAGLLICKLLCFPHYYLSAERWMYRDRER